LDLTHASERVAALADLSLAELTEKTSAEAFSELQSVPEGSLAKAAD